jgi:serine/threonine-protein kinase
MDCPACHQQNVDGARFCAKCGALLPAGSEQIGDSLVGQVVGGRYRITQILGEGGMGRVYVAEQQMGTNVRKVAVKTLQTQFAKDPQVLARFHRECGTVSQLEHPNTIQFFDFGQTADGQLYIAMEYVQGHSLSAVLAHGPLPPERVLKILAQACGSLEEAHGRGVVHRDLKPDNIILTTRAGQPDFVKVLDFGIAKRSEAKDQAQEQKLTQQGMVLGTPPYMSPEQFTGKELDLRSDIYSLGVMAYEMLTGRLPFDAETPWQWATQHMTAQPLAFEATPASAGIPQAMKQAILRALSKDRSQRQASMRQFYEEMAAGGAGVGVSSPQLAPAHPGGTVTVPTPQGTPAVPSHGGGPPPAAWGSAPQAAGFAPVAHPTPAGGQTFPTTPQPRAPAPTKRRGNGLIIGLAAAAGVLGIGTVIVVARQLQPTAEVPAVTAGQTPATVGEPEKSPALTAAADPGTPKTPAGSDPGSVKANIPPPEPPGGKTAPSQPVRKPTAPIAATPAPPAAPALTGDAACAEAKRLADNGDAAGAARMFATCSGPGSAAAKAAIARTAQDAVRRRIFNGDCAGARTLLDALRAIGAAGGAEAVMNSAPQCKK